MLLLHFQHFHHFRPCVPLSNCHEAVLCRIVPNLPPALSSDHLLLRSIWYYILLVHLKMTCLYPSSITESVWDEMKMRAHMQICGTADRATWQQSDKEHIAVQAYRQSNQLNRPIHDSLLSSTASWIPCNASLRLDLPYKPFPVYVVRMCI